MEAKFRTIRQLFSKPGAKFEVPDYQRGYEWGKKEFEDLWLDIQRVGSNVDQHYLGNIILLEKQRGQVYEIVDGQQRMVTVSLLVMAIRDQTIVGDRNDKRIDDIVNTYPSADAEQRLVLSEKSSNESFKSIWKGAIKQSSGRIASAYQYYVDRVKELEEQEVDQLLGAISNRLEVVQTQCYDTSLAYTIFQSQNERGKDVEPHILAKSRIYGAAEQLDNKRDREEVKGRWDHIYSLLKDELGGSRWTNDNIKIRRPMAQILLHADVDTPFRIDKSDLYRNFEEILTNFESVVEFVEWFQAEVDQYLEITSNRYDISARRLSNGSIRNLQYLNAASTQAEVLSHALYRRGDDEDLLNEDFCLSAVIAMRIELASRPSTDKRDVLYRVSSSVREAEDERAIRRILRSAAVEETPDDGEIIESIKSNQMNYSGPWQFRTLLALVGIEEQRQRALRVEIGNLHIEHIAPRRLSEDSSYSRWRRQIDEEEFDEVKNLIGNLTLLLPEDHASLDEQNFKSKQSVYKNSDLKIASGVADYDEWNIDTIRSRTERLAKEMVEKWSV